MSSSPSLVYLDSWHFSRLADRKIDSDKRWAQFDYLKQLANSGRVKFVYSAFHISEAAPLREDAVSQAVDRAMVLVDLCKRNALVSWEAVLGHEMNQLNARSLIPFEILAKNGDWFPDLGDVFSGFNPFQGGMANRAARRARPRQIRPSGIAHANADRKKLLSTIRDKYPMRGCDADTLLNFILGEATKCEATEAFMSCLRDPSWMMQWFESSYEQMNPIADLIRKPTRSMHANFCEMKDAVDRFIRARDERASFGESAQRPIRETAKLSDLISIDAAKTKFSD